MIYLTLMYDAKKEDEYLKISKTALQVADNIFQQNLLDGLKANMESSEIYIVNSLPFGCWPRNCKKIHFNTERLLNESGSRIVNIGFLNLPIIKSIFRYISYIRELNKLYKKNNQRICLIYGLYLPQLLALKWVKFFKKDMYVCLIVDDMPSKFGINKGNFIRRVLKNSRDKMVLDCLDNAKIANSFVFLTEHMKNVVDMGNRNYCVVEGVAPTTNRISAENLAHNNYEKIVFYAGTLNKEFGIGSLLNAFNLIEGSDYRLWICGVGDAKDDVIAAAKEDSRICYYGFVSKEKANELQSKATVLVNPRKNCGEYVKYSFPSKTIEYLLAEKPVVMYKLAGIPDEYDQRLYYVEDDTDQALANTIKRVCSIPYIERVDKAKETRNWLINNKCANAQVKKIIDVIADDLKIAKTGTGDRL